MQLSALDIHFLCKELKDLEGAKIDQVYSYAEKNVCFQLHKSGGGEGKSKKYYFHTFLPVSAGLSEIKLPNPRQTGFVTYLRKHVKGLFIEKIEQPSFDRVVKITAKFKDTTRYIHIELFNKGNIIVADENNTILNVFEQQKWEKRTLMPKYEYTLDVTPLPTNISSEAFQTDEAISKVLAKEGLGGFYAKLFCELSGISPLASADSVNLALIQKTITKTLEEPTKSFEYEKRIIPFKAPNTTKAETPFAVACVEDNLNQRETTEAKKPTKLSKELGKLQAIIKKQKAQQRNLEKNAKEYQEIGHIIQSRAYEIDQLIKEYDAGTYKPVKEDKKNKTITIELQ